MPQLEVTINQTKLRCVAWSPRDRYLAVGSQDKDFVIYDVRSSYPVQKIPDSEGVYSVAWSKDSQFVAFGKHVTDVTMSV